MENSGEACTPKVENFEEFKERVEKRTGLQFDDIAEGDPEDLLSGQILCKHGSLYLVTFGDPIDVDADGTEYFNEYRMVDLDK